MEVAIPTPAGLEVVTLSQQRDHAIHTYFVGERVDPKEPNISSRQQIGTSEPAVNDDRILGVGKRIFWLLVAGGILVVIIVVIGAVLGTRKHHHSIVATPYQTNGLATLTPYQTNGSATPTSYQTSSSTTPTSYQTSSSAAATPYQSMILEATTNFAVESNGVWQLIDCTGDNIPDLVYIKTSSTGTDSVEVHIASSASKYQIRILEIGTTFTPDTNGTWLMVPSSTSFLPDLVFFKTSNTGSNTVEIHIASGASNYRNRTLETGTAFANDNNGTWALYDYNNDGKLDLVYIKTSNTKSKTVELLVASGASKYKTIVLQTATNFTEENYGSWSVDAYTNNTSSDLIYIKSSGTRVGKVEVHIASASSKYQTMVLEAVSNATEDPKGVWSLIDYNRDDVLDLAYIKYQNTKSGNVEVTVFAG